MKNSSDSRGSWAGPITGILSLFIAGVAACGLLGWYGGLPWLANLGSAPVPMAPSTAVFFAAFAAMIFWSGLRPLDRPKRRLQAIFSVLMGLLALTLFVLSINGIHPPIEHLGQEIVDQPGIYPIGHMSIVTALCFMLAAGSLFLVSLPPGKRAWRALSAWWLGGLLILTSLLLFITYSFGVSLFFPPPLIPPAFLTSLGLLFLGLALCGLAAAPSGLSLRQTNLPSRQGHFFALTFLIVAAGLLDSGHGYYRRYEQQMRTSAEENLRSIAELKIDELRRWREERLDDAYGFATNAMFSIMANRVTNRSADEATRESFETWLAEIVSHSGYDEVALLDGKGRVVLTASKEEFRAVSPHVIRRMPEITALGWPFIVDFYRDEDSNRVYLTVLAPFVDTAGGKRPDAVLALRIHADDFLHPFVQGWPIPSGSAETLLVRREGDEVLYLNDLRFGTDAALGKRFPLTRTDLPSVQAVLGRRGIVEGMDYRGEPVVAAVGPVPGSPWFLVAKEDQAEIYAPIRERLWLVVAAVGVMLVGAALMVWFVWRQLRIRFYLAQYEASQALAESKEKLELVLRSTEVGVWQWNIAENKRYFDGQVCQLLGIDPESFEGTAGEFFRAVHPDDREDVRKALERTAGEGAPYESEYSVVWPDGTIRCINARGRLLRDASGQPLSIDGIVWDVTERQQIEDARLGLARIIDESLNEVYVFDAETLRFILVNQGAQKNIGYSMEELRVLTPLDIKPDYTMEAFLETIEPLRQGKLPVLNFETRHLRKDGTFYPVEVHLQLTSYAGRRVFAAIILDTTERKRAEEALRESEGRFRTLFDTMAEGVVLHELVDGPSGQPADYRILLANPAFEKHTGIPLEKAQGQLASELYSVDPPPFFDRYLQVAQTGEPLSFEAYLPAMSKHFRISAVSPAPNRFATVFEDITGRVRMEQELRDRNEELTRFIYTVSHDLKSPLVTVKTFLSYVEEDIQRQDTERLAKDIGFIRNAADKMTRLLDELLELSRIGRRKNPAGDMLLQEVVAEALALVAGRLSARGIRTEVTDRPILLHGDRQRLVEVFQNLADNAAKFMGEQPIPRLEIGAEETDEGIVVFVRDNGIGIDPRHQTKLFGLFEKLHPGTEGTGMGLAIVRRIIEVHGGRIWVESEGQGQGTTFRFTLPGTRALEDGSEHP